MCADSNVECVLCNARFADESDLKVHYRCSLVHPLCKTCNVQYKNGVEFTKHNISTHNAIGCVKCYQIFITPAKLENHYNSNPSHRPALVSVSKRKTRKAQRTRGEVKAQAVPKAFQRAVPRAVSRALPRAVLPREKQEKTQEYGCAHCGVSFHQRAQLIEHNLKKALHPHCIICARGFVSYQVYIAHMKQKHADILVVLPRLPAHSKIPTSPEAVSTQDTHSSLRNRAQAILHDTTPDWRCRQCKATFQKRHELVKHSITHARRCHMCAKHFTDYEAYQKHIHNDHPLRPGACLRRGGFSNLNWLPDSP